MCRRITIDRKAVRFYNEAGQVNCHWWLLNPFIVPDAFWHRVNNFFGGIKNGIRLYRTNWIR